jgi:oligoendopeptidase F
VYGDESILYLLVMEQTVNPLKYLKIQEQNYYIRIYEEFNFDLKKADENDEAINKLRSEIDEIKKASR